MTARRLWQRIKCRFGHHGFSGLANFDTFSVGAAYALSHTFVERMQHTGDRTWYRVWVALCPYCTKLVSVTENDVPIEMRSD